MQQIAMHGFDVTMNRECISPALRKFSEVIKGEILNHGSLGRHGFFFFGLACLGDGLDRNEMCS